MVRTVRCRRAGAWALEHRQLPLRTTLVKAQNVQIAIVAFDLEVAIVLSVPLIDVFDDFDLVVPLPQKGSDDGRRSQCPNLNQMPPAAFVIYRTNGAADRGQ